MYKEEALVLRKGLYQHQQSILLTRSRGRLAALVPLHKKHAQLAPGAHITCMLDGDRFLRAEDVEIIHVPLTSNVESIAWVHHLLEISFYYSQPELSDEALFEGVSLYMRLLSCRIAQERVRPLGLLCVFHFLYQTGFYSDPLFETHKASIKALNSLFFLQGQKEIMNALQRLLNPLTLADSEQLEGFVLQCLRTHPFYRSFKTICFVYPTVGLRNNNDG